MDAPPAMQKIRDACKKRGSGGAKGLGRAFRIFDDDYSNSLNFDEFVTGLRDYKVQLTDEEFQELFDYFDKDKGGQVDINEFINAFRKPLSGSRLKVVDLAFKKADRTGDGVIDCKDMERYYNVQEHPKYKNGEMTKKEVFEEFLERFEPDQKDGKVTRAEFLEYYACLGANIDSDAYFDLMVRSAWKL
ncbi:calcyphosin-like protein isoform X2 [Pocillopora verrucosa]|nr:calcyphosin-like protein isoform X2 [Pocillopora verrucosa]